MNEQTVAGAAGASVGRLLWALVDDAATFPPGDMPTAEAVVAHDRHRRAWYRGLVGPLLCAHDRLDELGAALESRSATSLPLAVALVVRGAGAVPAAVGTVHDDPRTHLAGVEVAPAGEEPAAQAIAVLAAAVPPEIPAAVEVPRGERCAEVLDAVAEAATPVRAKLRTGGLEAAAFPSEREVATFVDGCVRRGVAFKCTAGLHHAVRHRAPGTGFEHHGYLNILLAADAAGRGASPDDLAVLLAEREAGAVVEAVRGIDEAGARAARERFVSFGACSVTEPLDDAVALGLLRAR